MKELREHFQRRKEEDEEEAESGQIEIETLYVEMKKKIDAAEELGDSCIHAATMVTRNGEKELQIKMLNDEDNRMALK